MQETKTTSVSIVDRIKAIDGVESVATSYPMELPLLNGTTLDLSHALLGEVSIEQAGVLVTTKDSYLLSGLSVDHDPVSPTCDAEWEIVHYGNRRGSSDSLKKFYKAIGYNQYGDRDFDAEAVEQRLVKNFETKIRKDVSLMRVLALKFRSAGFEQAWDKVIDRLGYWFAASGADYFLDRVAGELYGTDWYRLSNDVREKLDALTEYVSDAAKESAWAKAVEAGDLGNPYALFLDIYDHSGLVYNLHGEGYSCQWDTSRKAALWVPSQSLIDAAKLSACRKLLPLANVSYFGVLNSAINPLTAKYTLDGGQTWSEAYPSFELAVRALLEAVNSNVDQQELIETTMAELKAQARSNLENFNDFLSGLVYGVLHYEFDRATGELTKSDACWGHIGYSYASDILMDELLIATQLSVESPSLKIA